MSISDEKRSPCAAGKRPKWARGKFFQCSLVTSDVLWKAPTAEDDGAEEVLAAYFYQVPVAGGCVNLGVQVLCKSLTLYLVLEGMPNAFLALKQVCLAYGGVTDVAATGDSGCVVWSDSSIQRILRYDRVDPHADDLDNLLRYARFVRYLRVRCPQGQCHRKPLTDARFMSNKRIACRLSRIVGSENTMEPPASQRPVLHWPLAGGLRIRSVAARQFLHIHGRDGRIGLRALLGGKNLDVFPDNIGLQIPYPDDPTGDVSPGRSPSPRMCPPTFQPRSGKRSAAPCPADHQLGEHAVKERGFGTLNRPFDVGLFSGGVREPAAWVDSLSRSQRGGDLAGCQSQGQQCLKERVDCDALLRFLEPRDVGLAGLEFRGEVGLGHASLLALSFNLAGEREFDFEIGRFLGGHSEKILGIAERPACGFESFAFLAVHVSGPMQARWDWQTRSLADARPRRRANGGRSPSFSPSWARR